MYKYYVENYFDVAKTMYDVVIKNKKEEITFVGFYEDAIEVIKELLMYEETTIHSLDIHSEEWDGYDKEYYVTLDNNFEVWAEPAFSKDHNRYLYGSADILFMTSNSNSSILNAIEYDIAVEVVFDMGNECDSKCSTDCYDECECLNKTLSKTNKSDNINASNENSVMTRVIKDKDGRVRGFEKEWETTENGVHYYSRYEHFSNDQKLLSQLMDNFNIKPR